ncbi:beta-1,4-galactosyltransferase 5-like [Homarus americanus]|uniref:beta-1,4-galactosyltransferase 5-like n=1 Tax=Homarus americanus TaxID=6706 RepID=UPI001C440941|nr:beta-1,4-galactosyltransferase 5-like [Homarus americanus]
MLTWTMKKVRVPMNSSKLRILLMALALLTLLLFFLSIISPLFYEYLMYITVTTVGAKSYISGSNWLSLEVFSTPKMSRNVNETLYQQPTTFISRTARMSAGVNISTLPSVGHKEESSTTDTVAEQSIIHHMDIQTLANETSWFSNMQCEVLCPVTPPKLWGPLKVQRTSPTLQEQEHNHPELELGGHYTPAECRARHKVAIIIPYRNRETNLAVFLNHTHPILQRQQIDYTIYVVEQAALTLRLRGVQLRCFNLCTQGS